MPAGLLKRMALLRAFFGLQIIKSYEISIFIHVQIPGGLRFFLLLFLLFLAVSHEGVLLYLLSGCRLLMLFYEVAGVLVVLIVLLVFFVVV